MSAGSKIIFFKRGVVDVNNPCKRHDGEVITPGQVSSGESTHATCNNVAINYVCICVVSIEEIQNFICCSRYVSIESAIKV